MGGTRHLFMPKLKEMPESCASCPFRDGNDEEFGVVIQKLMQKETGELVTGMDLMMHTHMARTNIRYEATMLGDFHCHCSAYTDDMEVKPVLERRQCPGATAHYRLADPNKAA